MEGNEGRKGRAQEAPPYLVWMGVCCISQGNGREQKPAACGSAKVKKASSQSTDRRDLNPGCPRCETALCSVSGLCAQVKGMELTRRGQGKIQELQSAPPCEKIFQAYKAFLGKISQNWSKMENSYLPKPTSSSLLLKNTDIGLSLS